MDELDKMYTEAGPGKIESIFLAIQPTRIFRSKIKTTKKLKKIHKITKKLIKKTKNTKKLIKIKTTKKFSKKLKTKSVQFQQAGRTVMKNQAREKYKNTKKTD